jgi:predicted RNase H-like nuclease
MPVVLGVDGRRGGWAVAEVRTATDGEKAGRARRASVRWHTIAGQDADGFTAVLDLATVVGADAIGVDCPIGLPRSAWRPCDLAAKTLLGRASARVFLAPPREVLAAADYAQARIIARRLLAGKGVSAQTYGLRRIVLALDDALTARPRRPEVARVVEVHPELSFMALAGRSPGDPLPSKHTDGGRAVRLSTLGRWCTPSSLRAAPDGDDHLDALAAAWSARRWADGAADVLGGDVDDHGLPMRIVI